MMAHPLPLIFYEEIVAAGCGRMPGKCMLAGWKNMHPAEQYLKIAAQAVNRPIAWPVTVRELSLHDLAAACLDLSAFDLGVDTAELRASRRSCLVAQARNRCGAIHERLQACQRVIAIPVLAPVTLGLDDYDAVAGDPLIA